MPPHTSDCKSGYAASRRRTLTLPNRDTNTFCEYRCPGPPSRDVGLPGDIYIDADPRTCEIYAKVGDDWQRWPGLSARGKARLFHPVHPEVFCTISAKNGTVGWFDGTHSPSKAYADCMTSHECTLRLMERKESRLSIPRRQITELDRGTPQTSKLTFVHTFHPSTVPPLPTYILPDTLQPEAIDTIDSSCPPQLVMQRRRLPTSRNLSERAASIQLDVDQYPSGLPATRPDHFYMPVDYGRTSSAMASDATSRIPADHARAAPSSSGGILDIAQPQAVVTRDLMYPRGLLDTFDGVPHSPLVAHRPSPRLAGLPLADSASLNVVVGYLPPPLSSIPMLHPSPKSSASSFSATRRSDVSADPASPDLRAYACPLEHPSLGVTCSEQEARLFPAVYLSPPNIESRVSPVDEATDAPATSDFHAVLEDALTRLDCQSGAIPEVETCRLRDTVLLSSAQASSPSSSLPPSLTQALPNVVAVSPSPTCKSPQQILDDFLKEQAPQAIPSADLALLDGFLSSGVSIPSSPPATECSDLRDRRPSPAYAVGRQPVQAPALSCQLAPNRKYSVQSSEGSLTLSRAVTHPTAPYGTKAPHPSAPWDIPPSYWSYDYRRPITLSSPHPSSRAPLFQDVLIATTLGVYPLASDTVNDLNTGK
ncbi:hypothetical protein HDZ31DRAFT_45831 [Schizophyllum fasciatum]